MRTHLRILALSSLFLLIGSAIAFHRAAGRRDSNAVPVIVAPSPAEISAGAASTVTVTMNIDGTSPTVVSLSTNDPLLSIPSSVTVPTGADTVPFTAQSSSNDEGFATITASANGTEAQGTLVIEGSGEGGGGGR